MAGRMALWTWVVLAVVAVSGSARAQDTAPAQEAAPPVVVEPGPQPVAAPEQGQLMAPAPEEERTAKNSVYAEGLGPGLLYSINYERLVIDELAVRVGLSYMSYGASAGSASSSVTFMTFPITASYIGISAGKHCLELGGGATVLYASGSASGLGASSEGSGLGGFGTVLIGYRIQPPNGGFQFRVGLSGMFGPGLGFDVKDPTAFGFIPWGYISLGGSF